MRVFAAAGVITRSNSQAQRDHVETPAPLTPVASGNRRRTGESPYARNRTPAACGESVRDKRSLSDVDMGPPGEVNSNPLRDTEGRIRGAVSVERDVTERARLASELEEQVRRSAVLFERVSTEAERLERMVAARTQEVLELQEARARERRLAAVGQLAAGSCTSQKCAEPGSWRRAHARLNADNRAGATCCADRPRDGTGAAPPSPVGGYSPGPARRGG